MDSASHNQPLDPRCREAHPERITIANETFERNDIRAQKLCMSERSLNRGDAQGAPYVFLGGVKYRPVERHDAFILGSIQQRKPQPPRARARRNRNVSV
jgi:hypothetical protein